MVAAVGIGAPLARTVIVQPDRLCREGLSRILGEFQQVRLLGAVASGNEAQEIAARERPDLFLTEIDLPDVQGLTLVQALTQVSARPQVIVLTRQSGHAYVTAAIGSGATGYLLRSSSPEELQEGIRSVLAGQTYVQPGLAAAMIGRRIGPQRERELTERECACLIHLAHGATNQEIAGALFLGEKTIRNTLTRLFQKLGARNRTEAVSLAREECYL